MAELLQRHGVWAGTHCQLEDEVPPPPLNPARADLPILPPQHRQATHFWQRFLPPPVPISVLI